MGTWGPGIYSNDTAEDVRDLCYDLFPYLDRAESERILFEEFKDTLSRPDENDDDYASFWYGYAAWLWKYGMLTDTVRDKTLALLENYAGIALWEESASPSDVKKRRAALDKLREKLLSPQPPTKKPRAAIRRPKNKPGDILIVKTLAEGNDACGRWLRKPGCCTSLFCDGEKLHDLSAYTKEQEISIDMRGNFFALLCTGTRTVPVNSHVRNVVHTDSVYAVYDYFSEEKPTLELLKSVGFLHTLKISAQQDKLCENPGDFPNRTCTYTPTVAYQTEFYDLEFSDAESHELLRGTGEERRFAELMQRRGAPDGVFHCIFLYEVEAFLLEREQYRLLSVPMCTLIDDSIPLPTLPNAEQIQKQMQA